MEPIAGTAPTKVITTYPIAGWVRDWTQRPRSGVAQTPTMAKWGTYLQQCSSPSTSPLSGELHHLLWPVTYTSGKQEELAFQPLVAKTPYQEGKAPIPEDAWYTDGSSYGQPLKWRVVAFHPKIEKIRMEDGEGKSRQWAELQAVWLMTTQEPYSIVVCTDGWAVYQGYQHGIMTIGWLVIGPFGGKSCGNTYGPLVRLRLLLYIM